MKIKFLASVFLLLGKNILAADAFFLEIPSSADSARSTPFGVKVKAQEVNSADTTLEFCIWVYDQGTHRYISQIWTPDGWKSGWTYYQPFRPNTGSERINWAYLRIYKQHTPDSFYISFKFRDGDTAQTKITSFCILDMAQEGGWLAGTLYKDPGFTSPYQNVNVIAKNSGGITVGAYITEDNRIDEGNPEMPGRFYIAAPVGYINSIEFQDSLGNLVNGYLGGSPPWQIIRGKTTWVDPFYIEDIEFIPDYPDPGDSVIIRVMLCNPGQIIHNVSVKVIYKTDHETNEIGTVVLDNIPAHSYVVSEIIWRNVERGKYEIEIKVTSSEFKITTFRFLQIGSGDVLINEIMYDPRNSGEWIEIINQGADPINLKNWTIEDPNTKNVITIEDKWFSRGEFAVVAESTSQVLRSIYGDFQADVFSLGSDFPSLRNDADTVIVRDSDGIVQDILRYNGSWATIGGKGISLERISPVIATNDPQNWGFCVTAPGATPGKVNSIYAEYLPDKAILRVEPKVFSPHKGVAFISYTLSFTKAYVRLYLYDRCGRCVRKLVDGYQSGAQSRHMWEKEEVTWSHIWDGRNDRGEILPIGIYIIYLEAKDQLTEALIYKKTTVVIAK